MHVMVAWYGHQRIVVAEGFEGRGGDMQDFKGNVRQVASGAFRARSNVVVFAKSGGAMMLLVPQ